jgi:hypothetical protein
MSDDTVPGRPAAVKAGIGSYHAPTRSLAGPSIRTDNVADRFVYFLLSTIRWRRILMPVRGYPIN